MLSASEVCYGYAGVPVLREVSMEVGAGSLLAVTGPNGSGKSTLLHVLAGVLPPKSGYVRRQAGCRVALLPQRTPDIDALPLTVGECVRIGGFPGFFRRSAGLSADSMMDRLGIASLSRRRMRELSGGQRQRVLIAQALVQQAEVYVLDEPTVALDAVSREVVHELLGEKVRAGAAVVLSSHDPGESALAGHTVHLPAPAA
ncbi:ATP-binding cassette domain-containing protein [Actinoplanes sp. CA-015351]|uniref:ATP-binding cassette domain-containing protein n=1 Tax=Actinoplanes sp. CA-015351 TaxID=3239897 RepID=UPI003D9734C4